MGIRLKDRIAVVTGAGTSGEGMGNDIAWVRRATTFDTERRLARWLHPFLRK
jgi:hypothetical protein